MGLRGPAVGGGQVLAEDSVIQLGEVAGECRQAGDRRDEGGRRGGRVGEGGEERELGGSQRDLRIDDRGDLRGAEHPYPQRLVAGTEVEGAGGPGGDSRIRGDHQHTHAAARPHREHVLGPREPLAPVPTALDLDDDRQESTPTATKLEHEVGAALHRTQAVEGRVHDAARGPPRQAGAEGGPEEPHGEPWLLPEEVDQGVVRERGHTERSAAGGDRCAIPASGRPSSSPRPSCGRTTRRRRPGTAAEMRGYGTSRRPARRSAKRRSSCSAGGPCTRAARAAAGTRTPRRTA